MCHYARLARRAWLTATTTCVISALLFGTSSLTAPSASANELRQQGRQHHGGGGGRGFGAVGIGLGIGGMVLDQMQRQRMQQPKAVSSRPEGAPKGGMTSGSSAKKKKGNPSVAKKQGVPNVAKKQDDPVPTNRPPEGATPPRNPPTQVAPPVPVVPVNPGAPPVVQAPPPPPVPGTPTGQNPPPQPPVVQAPPPSTSVSAPGGSDPRDQCPDHVAEITNGKRVFHRLWVLGYPADNETGEYSKKQWDAFYESYVNTRATFMGPGRQAAGSSQPQRLLLPTVSVFEKALLQTLAKAQPCEEVTLYFIGHGALRKLAANNSDADGEAFNEVFQLRDGSNEGEDILSDRHLGKLIKDNLKPNVSLTLIMSSCWGGGFAGKGNVVESGLVQVIGPRLKCVGGAEVTFDGELIKAVDTLAGRAQDGRVTAAAVEGQLSSDGWRLGEPDDTRPNGNSEPGSPPPAPR